PDLDERSGRQDRARMSYTAVQNRTAKQKAAHRDRKSTTFASSRELWKARLLSTLQALESAAGIKLGPLNPRENADPNLLPALVIARILRQERGREQRRIPRRDPWIDWPLQVRVSGQQRYSRRSPPTTRARFQLTLSVPVDPVAYLSPMRAARATWLY